MINKIICCIVSLCLITISTVVRADHVTCYNNNGSKIYDGETTQTVYSETLNVIWFYDTKNNFVFVEGMNCIVKLKKLKYKG